MSKVIYEIHTVKPRRQRTAAMRTWKELHELKTAFSSFVKIMRKHKMAVPNSENMRYQLRDLRARYFKELGGNKPSRKLIRVFEGKVYEAPLNPDNKVSTLTGYNLQEALNIIRGGIREFRHRRAQIHCSHDDRHRNFMARITTRKTGAFIKQYFDKVFKLTKIPKDQNTGWTGLELECIMPIGADFSGLIPFAKYINIGHDGSIQNYSDNEEGREVRVCIHRSEVRTVIPALLQALRAIGARVNKTCGMHVHLDQRNVLDPAATFTKLVRSLGLLYQVVPASRRDNSYCKRNRHANWADARNGSRYKAINANAYNSHGTIEVRLFGGTLSEKKICNWIEILWAIAEGDIVLRSPKTFEQARKYWHFSDDNIAWLHERAQRFDANGVTVVPDSEHIDEPAPVPVAPTAPPEPTEAERRRMESARRIRGNAIINSGAFGVRRITDDNPRASWVNAYTAIIRPATADALRGEIGRIENVAFVENPILPPSPDPIFFSNSDSTNLNLGGAENV